MINCLRMTINLMKMLTLGHDSVNYHSNMISYFDYIEEGAKDLACMRENNSVWNAHWNQKIINISGMIFQNKQQMKSAVRLCSLEHKKEFTFYQSNGMRNIHVKQMIIRRIMSIRTSTSLLLI